MNKIKFIANQDTNYIFHMLSVAKCGYDNAYGSTYRHHYPEGDLALLKENETLLTVCGGEHLGSLYDLMVMRPACAKTPAKDYYTELIRMSDSGGIPEVSEQYVDTVRRISAIMIKHYDHYIAEIWPAEKEKIEAYIPSVLSLFHQADFTEKAEEQTGCKLLSEYFIATLVTSVENGAEAIDIDREQDVFGIVRDPVDAFYFIGHEFIIYLLFNALKDEDAFRNYDHWFATEGLAEYYLKKINGDTRFFNAQQKYAEFYEKCAEGRKLSAAELYRMALQAEQAMNEET